MCERVLEVYNTDIHTLIIKGLLSMYLGTVHERDTQASMRNTEHVPFFKVNTISTALAKRMKYDGLTTPLRF